MRWHQEEYRHAREQVLCGTLEGEPAVILDNQYLDEGRNEGLFLNLDMMAATWQDTPRPIGEKLAADLFSFRRPPAADIEGHDILEEALQPAMPTLVTSANPALDAARCHTQVAFDRIYRSILRADCYRNKNLLFISGVNIDISPREAFPFPLIKFVPWAAYGSLRDGRSFVWEQEQVCEALRRQLAENPDRLSFDASIKRMADAEEIRFAFD
jgi:hypothetical protein